MGTNTNNLHHQSSNRIQGKRHIKHSPNLTPFNETQNASNFLIKSSTPYISAIKQITKKLNKFSKSKNSHTVNKFQNEQYKTIKYITVKGMGKTIEKVASIGIHFQKDYKVDVLTRSITVLDEFAPIESNQEPKNEGSSHNDDEEDEEEDTIYEKRTVSSIEIRIWIKRD
ncbi:subunit of ribonucleases P/MRP, putative [Candida dubliniensis CD36]|uniref:Subunit of ribonucleases P/MRP, putative n=1 Tax=Candida dubliniensis (strain CD36 / ATCC MYA-646 / CBS 7987 / NCPF 3949 / NRRL Y-17841) TaxID=573826 RepID=B9WFE7_CANDC|nr:subunit of ribonucleases P/MRP, putative [Candida dubliniensis CD36]CAX41966.1 subunit of ribonucleases P/MRP, putative [Candida dubliniensis CD36]